MPQNEPNLAPYVTKIPTDGSVNGVIIIGLGAGDLTRVSLALGQYGIAPQGAGDRQLRSRRVRRRLPGIPEGLGAAPQPYISGPAAQQSVRRRVRQGVPRHRPGEPEWANIFGGADKALPFEATVQYSAMMALKTAMIAAKFTGRPDTEALISALEKVNLPLGPDAPGGAIIMNPQDHQGAQTEYVYRMRGRTEEEILATIPGGPDSEVQLPRCPTV